MVKLSRTTFTFFSLTALTFSVATVWRVVTLVLGGVADFGLALGAAFGATFCAALGAAFAEAWGWLTAFVELDGFTVLVEALTF